MPPLIDRDSWPVKSRIRVEEAELREGLGEAYTGYARTTARLVPHVW
jgi:protein-S-isoprenylcysteine O-methyltransferase Ste14